MSDIDLTVEICGMSGDGTIAAGALLNDAMAESGLSIMAFDSYPAEIRGFGRCVTRSRIGNRKMVALNEKTQVLISLDDQQSFSRIPYLDEDSLVIFDNGPQTLLDEGQSMAAHVKASHSLIGVPFGNLATASSGSRRGRNLTALGAVAALFSMDTKAFHCAIEKKFMRKGKAVLEANLLSFDAGFTYISENYKDYIRKVCQRLEKKEIEKTQLLSGNAAICQGALDADLGLYFGYPITPATPIMELLAKKLPEKGGSVIQMEDEISAIGAVLGSFFSGTRALTATSGPGFALMTELITHGIMAEIPAVIIDAQRGGPATGLPTKTEQSDLHAAVYGGPGDSPRLVIAPSNVEECYSFTARSFQLAEKYQIPVIILTDFFLNNRVETVPEIEPDREVLFDGNLYPRQDDKDIYQRFEVTTSGVSPRSIPGMEGYIFTTTGLEVNASGKPDYGPDTHMEMSAKRHRKVLSALADLPCPEEFFYREKQTIGVISWGSSFGAALEAAEMAYQKGILVGALKIATVFPLHKEQIQTFMNKCETILVPELNFQGQLSTLLEGLTNKTIIRLNLATGQPITPQEVFTKIEEVIA